VAETSVPSVPSVPSRGLQIPGGPLIPENELRWRYSTSSGPGGQHVNRSNTRVEVVFDVESSAVLDERQRELIESRLGRSVRVVASDERSQWRNRRLAAERLGERLADALEIPVERRTTAPSRGVLARRREARVRGQTRRSARRWTYDDDA
jgi:ribosome-associated protein